MRKSFIIIFIAIPIFFSCEQKRNSKSGKLTKVNAELKGSEIADNQDSEAISIDKFIDTKYEYTDTTGKYLIIENSLPKGGQKYTDIYGNEYVYAIFWTQITNKMDSPFEVSLNFPTDSFELPSSSDNHFKLFLLSETMIATNAPLLNYGLKDINKILDNKLQQSSSLERTVNANETFLFYVVALFKEGVDGVIRAGIRLESDKVYYRVNDLVIQSGYFNSKNLKAKK